MPRKRRKPIRSSHSSFFSNPDDLIVDTTGRERFHVFELCAAMSKYIAAVLMGGTAVSTFLLLQFFMDVQMFSTPELKLVSIIAMGFIGIANIICGLLLLAAE
jgi:hypothetical protein